MRTIDPLSRCDVCVCAMRRYSTLSMFYKKPFIRNTSLISEKNKKRRLVSPGKIRNAKSIISAVVKFKIPAKITSNQGSHGDCILLPNRETSTITSKMGH